MRSRSLTLVLTVAVLAALGHLVGACTKSSSGTGTPMIEGDGQLANWLCNGSFLDPAPAGTNLAMSLTTYAAELANQQLSLPGTALLPVTLGNATSGLVALSGSNAQASLTVPDSTRVNFRASHEPDAANPAGYVDMFGYYYLSPAVGDTNGAPASIQVFPVNLYNALVGSIGFSAADLAGTYQFLGEVGDCASQQARIQYAYVGIGGAPTHLCGVSTALPCVSYLKNGTPNGEALVTDQDGAFLLFGLPPAKQTIVQIFGVATSGKAAVQIGAITVNGSAGSMSMGASEPIGPSNPAGAAGG